VLPLRGQPASPLQLQEYLCAAFEKAAAHLPHGRVGGIGVAWPAAIAASGEPRDYPLHNTGLRDQDSEPMPLTPIVHEALAAAGLGPSTGEEPPPVVVLNDADADMLYELRYGVAKGAANVMSLKVCGGIGMTLVHDGRIVRGGNGTAGEIEHVKVRLDKVEKLDWKDLVPLEDLPPCPCKGMECVGRFTTGASIIEQLSAYFEEKLTPTERGRRIEAETMAPVVSAVCGRAGSLLGQAILGPVLAFDPELVVITSFPRSDALVDAVRTKLKRGTPVCVEGENIVPGTTGSPITAIGAAQQVIEQCIVPRIEREVPISKGSVLRYNLPTWMRQQIPAGVKDVHELEADYALLRRSD